MMTRFIITYTDYLYRYAIGDCPLLQACGRIQLARVDRHKPSDNSQELKSWTTNDDEVYCIYTGYLGYQSKSGLLTAFSLFR